jgi:MFS family permease
MNVTRLIGPALAGFIVAAFGAGMCFLLNALSYIAVIIALFFVKTNQANLGRAGQNIMAELKGGLSYAWNTVPVRAFISLLAIFNIGAMAYTVLLPVFVKLLGGNANTLGYLMSASAIGSLAGTMALASRGSVVGLGRWVVRSSFVFSIALIGFSFTDQFWTAAAVLVVMGASMMVLMASVNTIVQAVVEEDKRGRVMSLFTMAFMGTAPFGSLLGGAVADRFGFSTTMLGCGIYCLLVSLAFLKFAPHVRTHTRALYVEKGLIIAEQERQVLAA